jgi:adenine-specific DNA-methyltransferase
VTIDDNEGHYLKVLMDEVFGRTRFIANKIWEKRNSRENRRVFSFKHDHLLCYARDPATFESSRNALALTADVLARYKNPDDDPRGLWQSVSANAQAGHATPSQFYTLTLPSGRRVDPPKGRCWLYTEPRMQQEVAAGNIWFGASGDNAPRIKKFLGDSESSGLTPETIWNSIDVGTNDEAKKSMLKLLPDGAVFDNPKPEGLLQRVVHIATNPNDLILDSFLGSGTTAAVAHKMGRRWIGIEMGDHAVTHCLPRLEKVLAGEQGGISGAVNWQGGGGFRFMRLGDPVFSADGRIHADVRFDALAAFVWQQETRQAYLPPAPGALAGTPLIGVHEGVAIYLLYNGILGDRRPESGNVLTLAVLQALKAVAPHTGPRVVYGEACRLGAARLAAEGITFRQIPYELAAR